MSVLLAFTGTSGHKERPEAALAMPSPGLTSTLIESASAMSPNAINLFPVQDTLVPA